MKRRLSKFVLFLLAAIVLGRFVVLDRSDSIFSRSNDDELNRSTTPLDATNVPDSTNALDATNVPDATISFDATTNAFSCAECHSQEVAQWKRSFHRNAMDVANETNVLGDFSGSFVHFPTESFRLFSDAELQTILNAVRENREIESTNSLEERIQRLEQADFDERPESATLRNVDSDEAAFLFSATSARRIVRRIRWENQFFSGLKLLAYALDDVSEETRTKIERLLTESERKSLEEERQFLRSIGATKPSDRTAARERLAEIVQKLVEERKLPSFSSPPESSETPARFESIETKRSPDGKFQIRLNAQNDEPRTFDVKFVLGVYPLQQYLVEFEDGRVQTIPLAWNSKDRRWFHLYPKEPLSASDPLHWTGRRQNWNYMCADCHATDFQKNFDDRTNSYASRWESLGVVCSACHGDCRDHEREARAAFDSIDSVSLSKRPDVDFPKNRAVPSFDYRRTPKRLAALSSNESIDQCAGCHARRETVAVPTNRPIASFGDYFLAENVHSDAYYPDGQILEEDFEYASFSQCRMFGAGVRCSDCHDSHSLELKKEGNQLCCQCHSAEYYDAETHYFHSNDFDLGTNCVDCHMPTSKYMTFDRRYDHNISIPRPELTLALGTPNVCNDCHRDRFQGETARWAQDWIDERFSPEKSIRGGRVEKGEHYAYAIDAGKKRTPDAPEKLLEIASEPDWRKVRPIVRAAAIELLKTFDSEAVRNGIDRGLADSSFLVRLAAVRGFENRSIDEKKQKLIPTLDDPVRSVRLEAFRILSFDSRTDWDEKSIQKFNSVQQEYIRWQKSLFDQPSSWLNLGVLETNLKRPTQDRLNRTFLDALQKLERSADSYSSQEFGERKSSLQRLYFEKTRSLTDSIRNFYETGIKIDPDFFPLRINLAMLRHERGEFEAAEAEFREAIRVEPQSGEAWYSLALLLNEIDRREESTAAFEQAAIFAPENARIHYNFGVGLDRDGRTSQAIQELRTAVRLEPGNADFVYALALFLKKANRNAEAAELLETFLKTNASRPEIVRLLDALR